MAVLPTTMLRIRRKVAILDMEARVILRMDIHLLTCIPDTVHNLRTATDTTPSILLNNKSWKNRKKNQRVARVVLRVQQKSHLLRHAAEL
jgi:hypothetical protein